MKIVCLMGSPRYKGNSTFIANHFLNTAGQLGAEIETFTLNRMNYKGCQACRMCKTKLDRCALKDDLAPVFDAIHATDVLVLASPVFFGELTSQMKMFMDRTYSFFVPDFFTNPQPSRLSPGKKLVFILTQGQPNEAMFADIFPRYDFFFQTFGFTDTHLIRACGVNDPTDVQERKDILELAATTAKQIMT